MVACPDGTAVLAYARWCGFCKPALRIFERAASQFAGPRFALLNVDRSPAPAAVRQLPALLVCDRGHVRVSIERPTSLTTIENTLRGIPDRSC